MALVTIFSSITSVVKGIWDMGGNLRAVYEASADARQRAEDQYQTLQRVLTFAGWVVAVASYEIYVTALPNAVDKKENGIGDADDDDESRRHNRRKGGASSSPPANNNNYSFVSSTNPASA